ncbi:M20 aminoacylase family protein [Sneathiella chinensis]|uniref:Amidohydrolase n=1 Tax=Sneathiella chinensis TaxID=349750 RepID=A0ABQ5TYA9_9PROT|nr:M20 aminoacylase family protein [Sneathiella chinensis]GLQ04892.1 amidohydrolase [Sneathiella chinensis]
MSIKSVPDDIGSEEFANWLQSLRRDIHRHPETAFKEERTSNLVANLLESWGLVLHRGLAKTGIVATLHGKRGPGRTIGLRADMDALFIDEKNNFKHKSCQQGVMHACGHDGHTAMLLGAARLLAKNPDFKGTVQFIFQPAEESEGGGRVMIEEGLFDMFPCDAVYAVHNAPGLPTGDFAIRSGPMLAAGDTWEVEFSGSGGHGAMPHTATDPITAAGAFINTVSTIVARNVPSSEAAVLSIGHIHAGDYNSPNIIPGNVLIRGTARSFTAETRDLLEDRLHCLADHNARAFQCEAAFRFIRRYPPLVNRQDQVDIAAQAARHVAGDDRVTTDIDPIGGSEDFAFMLEEVPGAYMLIGNGPGPFVHSDTYDFNDDILLTGVRYWMALVSMELDGQTS